MPTSESNYYPKLFHQGPICLDLLQSSNNEGLIKQKVYATVHWEEPIGSGGQGGVYPVTKLTYNNKEIHLPSVIKFQPSVKQGKSQIPSCLREANINVVVHGCAGHSAVMLSEDDDTEKVSYQAILMPKLPGQNLSSQLRKSNLLLDRLAIVRLLLQTLHAEVHKEGIVHRDLKPEQFMVGCKEGQVTQVVPIDFGFSYNKQQPDSRQFNGATPGYIAPEDVDYFFENGRMPDRTDFGGEAFAIGIILLRCLGRYNPSTLLKAYFERQQIEYNKLSIVDKSISELSDTITELERKNGSAGIDQLIRQTQDKLSEAKEKAKQRRSAIEKLKLEYKVDPNTLFSGFYGVPAPEGQALQEHIGLLVSPDLEKRPKDLKETMRLVEALEQAVILKEVDAAEQAEIFSVYASLVKLINHLAFKQRRKEGIFLSEDPLLTELVQLRDQLYQCYLGSLYDQEALKRAAQHYRSLVPNIRMILEEKEYEEYETPISGKLDENPTIFGEVATFRVNDLTTLHQFEALLMLLQRLQNSQDKLAVEDVEVYMTTDGSQVKSLKLIFKETPQEDLLRKNGDRITKLFNKLLSQSEMSAGTQEPLSELSKSLKAGEFSQSIQTVGKFLFFLRCLERSIKQNLNELLSKTEAELQAKIATIEERKEGEVISGDDQFKLNALQDLIGRFSDIKSYVNSPKTDFALSTTWKTLREKVNTALSKSFQEICKHPQGEGYWRKNILPVLQTYLLDPFNRLWRALGFKKTLSTIGTVSKTQYRLHRLFQEYAQFGAEPTSTSSSPTLSN